MRTIKEIIQKLQELNIDLETARYSLDTVNDLRKLSDELREHAKLIQQCCY